MKTRLALAALVFNLTLIVAWILASLAHAGIGISVGPHFGASNPLTPHVGRVYYKSGGRGLTDSQIANRNIDAALGIVEHPVRDYKRLQAIRCKQQHMAYFMRHGVTTPTPLRGYSGCAKYAMDAAYWRHRRGETPNFPKGPIAQLQFSIGLAARQPLQIW